MPDLMDADVEAATVKIRSAYRGFQTRKKMQDTKEVMPDLNCVQVQDATVKIQAAFRGHKARQEVKDRRQVDDSSETEESQEGKMAATSDSTETETEEDSLPNLEDSDVENAAVKIQSVYRG